MSGELQLLPELKHSPRGLQRLQEQTPKENPPADCRAPGVARIVLQRLSDTSGQLPLRLRHPKRLLDEYSRREESAQKEGHGRVRPRQETEDGKSDSDSDASTDSGTNGATQEQTPKEGPPSDCRAPRVVASLVLQRLSATSGHLPLRLWPKNRLLDENSKGEESAQKVGHGRAQPRQEAEDGKPDSDSEASTDSGAKEATREETPKRNPRADCRAPRMVRIVPQRLLATSVHLPLRLRPKKRLLDENSRSGESAQKEKKVGHGRAWPHKEAEDSKSYSDSDASTDSGAKDATRDGQPPLSAYEMKRLKNIQENATFFAALNLLESAAALKKKKKPAPSRTKKRAQSKPEGEELVRRRSMRLQRVDPSGVPLPEAPVQWDPFSSQDNLVKPPGPLEMKPLHEEQEEAGVQRFLNTWKEASRKAPDRAVKSSLSSLKGYRTRLQGMTLEEDRVAKAVKNRIFSIAIHPSESRTLVAAGDKWGQVGLWDVDAPCAADGIYMFDPHSRPVGCLQFSPSNPAHLLSVSYDGTLRCGDVTKAVFDEVYRDEGSSFSCFDFLSADGSALIVGHWEAEVAVVDQRTPGTSCKLLAQVSSKTVRTVHVHPVDRNYFLTAGAGSIFIYDVRSLRPKGMRPVASLSGNAKSVGSAYFSPVTGDRVVAVCADDRIRVYDTSSLHSEAPPLLLSLKHNNNTGRWLTRFRPVWDPKQDDCFVVGSMERPRRIEVFHQSGELVHGLVSEDYLGSVCSINAMHPTRDVLVGGNSSGRVHVFMD